mmetsp:Transcript_16493/g.33928  ORF Transcript_16493/g.33928 Transcript_16493/m.33928 type:complete len:251 (+) Transcript_16493:1762-2514(+)
MIPKTGYRCFHSAAAAAADYYYYYVPGFGFSRTVSDEPGLLGKGSPRSGLSRSPKSYLPRDSRSSCTSSVGFRLGFLWSAMVAMTCTCLGAGIVEREKTMIFDLSSRVTAPWTCDQGILRCCRVISDRRDRRCFDDVWSTCPSFCCSFRWDFPSCRRIFCRHDHRWNKRGTVDRRNFGAAGVHRLLDANIRRKRHRKMKRNGEEGIPGWHRQWLYSYCHHWRCHGILDRQGQGDNMVASVEPADKIQAVP